MWSNEISFHCRNEISFCCESSTLHYITLQKEKSEHQANPTDQPVAVSGRAWSSGSEDEREEEVQFVPRGQFQGPHLPLQSFQAKLAHEVEVQGGVLW